MNKISAVISAYNEEQKLAKCLESVKWVDEIIVVDNSSTDKTNEIANKYTNNVFKQKNDPLLIDLQKNFGFQKATSEWVLSIDADEKVSESLKDEIKSLLEKNDLKDGYFIPRKNIIFGKTLNYTGWYPDHQLRLFKKGKGEFKTKLVHEGIKVDGETDYLTNDLIHHNYESIVQFVNKNMIIYAKNQAENLIKNNFTIKPSDFISQPAKEFLSRFFARQGYKDGMHGLVLSLLMATSQVIVLTYVWEKQGFTEVEEKNVLSEVEKEIQKFIKELKYWIVNAKVDSSKNPATKYYLRIKNKIS